MPTGEATPMTFPREREGKLNTLLTAEGYGNLVFLVAKGEFTAVLQEEGHSPEASAQITDDALRRTREALGWITPSVVKDSLSKTILPTSGINTVSEGEIVNATDSSQNS